MITTSQIKAIAYLIDPNNTYDADDGPVVTDVMLIVRGRHPDNLSTSWLTTVATPETDFVTLAGMLHYAAIINDAGDRGIGDMGGD